MCVSTHQLGHRENKNREGGRGCLPPTTLCVAQFVRLRGAHRCRSRVPLPPPTSSSSTAATLRMRQWRPVVASKRSTWCLLLHPFFPSFSDQVADRPDPSCPGLDPTSPPNPCLAADFKRSCGRGCSRQLWLARCRQAATCGWPGLAHVAPSLTRARAGVDALVSFPSPLFLPVQWSGQGACVARPSQLWEAGGLGDWHYLLPLWLGAWGPYDPI